MYIFFCEFQLFFTRFVFTNGAIYGILYFADFFSAEYEKPRSTPNEKIFCGGGNDDCGAVPVCRLFGADRCEHLLGMADDPATTYDPNFYESLDYEVSFANTESNSASRLTIEIDTENSSYNITTEAVGTMSFPTPTDPRRRIPTFITCARR